MSSSVMGFSLEQVAAISSSRIFPTQRLKPGLLGLLHWQTDSFSLCHWNHPCSSKPAQKTSVFQMETAFSKPTNLFKHTLSWDCLPVVRYWEEARGNKRPSLHLEGWDGAQVGEVQEGGGIYIHSAELATARIWLIRLLCRRNQRTL